MSNDALPDLWATRDLPVLIATARLLDESGGPLMSHQIADAAGVEFRDAIRGLINLGNGYLEVRDASTMAERDCYVTGITAQGLRAAGQWPSADTAVDRFLAALDKQIDNTVEGTPKASRLRALRENAGSIGRDVLVEVMGGVLTGRIPL